MNPSLRNNGPHGHIRISGNDSLMLVLQDKLSHLAMEQLSPHTSK